MDNLRVPPVGAVDIMDVAGRVVRIDADGATLRLADGAELHLYLDRAPELWRDLVRAGAGRVVLRVRPRRAADGRLLWADALELLHLAPGAGRTVAQPLVPGRAVPPAHLPAAGPALDHVGREVPGRVLAQIRPLPGRLVAHPRPDLDGLIGIVTHGH